MVIALIVILGLVTYIVGLICLCNHLDHRHDERRPLNQPQRRMPAWEIQELERQLLPPVQVSDWITQAEQMEQMRWDQVVKPTPSGVATFVSPDPSTWDNRRNQMPTGISYVPAINSTPNYINPHISYVPAKPHYTSEEIHDKKAAEYLLRLTELRHQTPEYQQFRAWALRNRDTLK